MSSFLDVWDSALDTVTNIGQGYFASINDRVSQLLPVGADQNQEGTRTLANPAGGIPNVQPVLDASVTPSSNFLNGVNWSMVGAIAGVIGMAFVVLKK